MGELIFLACILVVCGVFFYLTFGFQVSVLDTSGGAALWPRIVIVFLVVFLVIRAIQVIRERGTGDQEEFIFTELFKGKRLFFLTALAVYILVFKFLGYIASTILFLAVVVNVFYKWTKDGFGSLKSILIRNALIVVFTVAMYFFFAEVVHIMLPAGSIWPA